MKFLLISHLLFSAVTAAAVVALSGLSSALAFTAGASVGFFNLLGLVMTWPRILEKKQVALSVGVIVFKFAILGWIIYTVVTEKLLNLGWFSAGLGVLILSTLATSFQFAHANPEKAEE